MNSSVSYLVLLAVVWTKTVVFGAALELDRNTATDPSLSIDFAKTNGIIRPLHGVNLGPLCYRGMVDLSSYHRDLALPLTRLHDVVWVNYDAVDISTIFRDFRNDPNRQDNYEFSATDDYIAAIVKAGSPILYRLGESIEHTPRKYRVHPPKDFGKWAEICCHVIQHYNAGWASGFQYNVRYWEIWNEPENQPAMWTGTDEQYFELYEATSKAVKERWPDLKVGGPALGNTGEFVHGQFRASEFLVKFLRYCQGRRLPLDFFSWHRYANEPGDLALRARAIRQLLDQFGFLRSESHLNEWNFLPNEDWGPVSRAGQGRPREQVTVEMGGPKGAAFAAWSLLSLQDAPVDMANFYTGEIQMFGLFTISGVPRKNYYAFRAFRMLLDTPIRVQTPTASSGHIAIGAGLNFAGDAASVLLSNFSTGGPISDLVLKSLPWGASSRFELYLVDDRRDLELVRSGPLSSDNRLALPELVAPSVALLKLFPASTISR
jgi:hypothetical protein